MIDFPYDHLRDDWVRATEPVRGPAPFPWATADRVAIHYTAALNLTDGDPGEDWGQIPAYLRAIHHDYLTNPARGYSIGYGIAVDQRGETWQLRGITWKNAANLNWNHRTLAVLCLVDAADPLRPPAVVAVRQIVAWFRSQSPFGAGVQIVGHRDIGATACPGGGIYAQIRAGMFEPLPPEPPQQELPPPIHAEVDDMIAELLYLPDSNDVVIRGASPARRVNGDELSRLKYLLGEPRRIVPGSSEASWVVREIAAYDDYVGV